jgi:hypothetical protein
VISACKEGMRVAGYKEHTENNFENFCEKSGVHINIIMKLLLRKSQAEIQKNVRFFFFFLKRKIIFSGL